MNWFLVVIFAEGYYMFEDPYFQTEAECQRSVMNKQQVELWQEELEVELKYTVQVNKVECIDAKKRQEVLRRQGIYLAYL